MKDSLFVFQNDIIDSNSVTEHASGTNVDFFAVPTSSLTSISALEGKIVLYFRSSNTFENSKANQATVTLNTAVGSESRAAIATWGLTLEEGKIYIFDDTRSSYPGNYGSIISGIDSIVRPTAERFTSSGSSLPTGGVVDQVLTKLSATDGDVDWEYLQDIYLVVENASGGTLPKGTPVHVTGENGNGNPTVIAARADTPSAMPANYVLAESIANGAEGVAFLLGRISGVNTSSFTAGDVVYVGATGGYTTTKPTGTNLIQNLGIVTAVDATNGGGWIYGAGRSNDVPNLPTGKFFIGSASNTQESAYTLPTADGSADQFLKTNGSGAVTFTSITQATGNELENVVEDTTPQLGGNLDINGNKIVSTSNGDIDIEPNGTGDVLLGNFKFDADQSVGAGQDDHVLTYDNSTGKISLEAAAGGGDSYIQFNGSANNGNTGQDRYIPLGGNSVDTSSIQIYSEAMCPFNGVVESITVRTDNASGSTVTKLWVDGTAVNSSTDTLSANTPLTIAFGDSVSAGDLIACSMNTTNAAGDSYVTVLIKKS